MRKSINRSVFTLITLCAGMSGNGIVMGAEVLGTTQNAIGATDFYQVKCSDPVTDHLSVKIIDQTPGTSNDASVLPQYVNLHISKFDKTQNSEITGDASEISPGEQVELTVPAGMGPYQFYFEAKGPEKVPNSKKKLTQTIRAEYSCLNDAGNPINPKKPVQVKTKKIKNTKYSKLSVKCGKNKINGETAKLHVKLTNATVPLTTIDPARVAMNAQIIKGTSATNTTDFNGDDVYSEEASLRAESGVYSVLINSTANDARKYALQYNCRDSVGNETDPDPELKGPFN